MKILLNQFSAYHLWANQQIVDCIKPLPQEWKVKEVESSFKSITSTMLHMWDAESIWWQRMKLQEQVARPSDTFNGSFDELSAALLAQSRQWNDWVSAAQKHMLDHEFIYYNSKKEKFKQPVYQVLLHLFNHGTYHRGQLVTMLHQLGVTNITATDFIVWSRKKNAGLNR